MSAPVILVTGGSRGIGAATARLAAKRGYNVALTYANNESAAARVADEIRVMGRQSLALRANVASEEDVARAFAAVDEKLGRLSAVVINSGITGHNSRLDEADTSTLREVINVNLLGAMFCAREAVRRMSTRHGGTGGAIVFISSRASVYGSAGEYVWYAAAKGGMDSLGIGLAREVGREGIRVNVVSPGPIGTEIHRPGRLEKVVDRCAMGRAGRPEEVAEAALFLVSDAAAYCTGANLAVAGGA
ncbi:MAG: SDR family oxidoreductase [Steroidobacteraceae bacterium]|nr:SDR family oxidoreductase [Steroidobacteraceae bacterium]